MAFVSTFFSDFHFLIVDSEALRAMVMFGTEPP